MKRFTILLSSLFLVLFFACHDDYYIDYSNSVNSIKGQSGKDQSLLTEGVAFYLVADFKFQPGMGIDLEYITLESEPFISNDEIVAYDSAAHVFELNKYVDPFFMGSDNIDGKVFVVMVDNDTLYAGVVWSPVHSMSLSNIVLTQPFMYEYLQGTFVELAEAYPSESFATGPVNLNDERLIDRLAADGKLKTLVTGSGPVSGPEPLSVGTDTLYYQEDIFNEAYKKVYGKWILEFISGGKTGDGYEPNFDYLEFIPYGIYQFVNADTLLEFGKVIIEEQSDTLLKISLNPDQCSTIFFNDSEKFVEFTGDNQLDLIAPCCDRYNYHFKRGNEEKERRND